MGHSKFYDKGAEGKGDGGLSLPIVKYETYITIKKFYRCILRHPIASGGNKF